MLFNPFPPRAKLGLFTVSTLLLMEESRTQPKLAAYCCPSDLSRFGLTAQKRHFHPSVNFFLKYGDDLNRVEVVFFTQAPIFFYCCSDRESKSVPLVRLPSCQTAQAGKSPVNFDQVWKSVPLVRGPPVKPLELENRRCFDQVWKTVPLVRLPSCQTAQAG